MQNGTETSPQNGKLLGNIGETAEAKVDIATKIMEYLNDQLGYRGDLKIIGREYYRYTDGKVYNATYKQDENGYFIVTKVEQVNLDATIDPETETITTPFGTYKKPVEGEDSNEPIWHSYTDESGNKIYRVYNEKDRLEYEYDVSGALVCVLEPIT